MVGAVVDSVATDCCAVAVAEVGVVAGAAEAGTTVSRTWAGCLPSPRNPFFASAITSTST